MKLIKMIPKHFNKNLLIRGSILMEKLYLLDVCGGTCTGMPLLAQLHCRRSWRYHNR